MRTGNQWIQGQVSWKVKSKVLLLDKKGYEQRHFYLATCHKTPSCHLRARRDMPPQQWNGQRLALNKFWAGPASGFFLHMIIKPYCFSHLSSRPIICSKGIFPEPLSFFAKLLNNNFKEGQGWSRQKEIEEEERGQAVNKKALLSNVSSTSAIQSNPKGTSGHLLIF